MVQIKVQEVAKTWGLIEKKKSIFYKLCYISL